MRIRKMTAAEYESYLADQAAQAGRPFSGLTPESTPQEYRTPETVRAIQQRQEERQRSGAKALQAIMQATTPSPIDHPTTRRVLGTTPEAVAAWGRERKAAPYAQALDRIQREQSARLDATAPLRQHAHVMGEINSGRLSALEGAYKAARRRDDEPYYIISAAQL